LAEGRPTVHRNRIEFLKAGRAKRKHMPQEKKRKKKKEKRKQQIGLLQWESKNEQKDCIASKKVGRGIPRRTGLIALPALALGEKQYEDVWGGGGRRFAVIVAIIYIYIYMA
jgi:hypothetical protein